VKRASFLPPRAPGDTCSVYHCSEFEIGSPLRRERKLLADKCSRLAKARTSQWTALPEAAKMTAHLARGEIVALLQITHLMGGIGQLAPSIAMSPAKG
jgi:hypothetical protein